MLRVNLRKQKKPEGGDDEFQTWDVSQEIVGRRFGSEFLENGEMLETREPDETVPID